MHMVIQTSSQAILEQNCIIAYREYRTTIRSRVPAFRFETKTLMKPLESFDKRLARGNLGVLTFGGLLRPTYLCELELMGLPPLAAGIPGCSS